ncbi:MAG: Zn-dependent hydrolase [Pseudomonadota bacterium]
MQASIARTILPACAAAMLLGCTQSADVAPHVATNLAANVSADLPGELAKFREVHMPFNATGLSARQQQMIDKLAKACGLLEEIYWEQSDPQGLQLYRQLNGKDTVEARNLRRFLRINGSRFNLIREQQPFVGTAPMPPGRNLYPPDLTVKTLEQYAAAHPAQKAALYDPYTVVQRKGSLLQAIPYHIAYAKWLQPMAALLREAADLSDDAAFARYLRLRADALLTDDYFESDLAWLDLENPQIDLIFAPYETYLDDLAGVKASYGAAILVRNEGESRKLDIYQKYVADIQDALPLPAADRPSKKGLRSPMEVMDAPLRAGDLRHGYQAVADNLPNDPRVHELRGSKKIFFKNFMDARVDNVILPIGHRLLEEKQAAQASAEGYLATTLMHEMAHGLGPAFAHVNGQKQDVRIAIGASYSALEEAKADIVGLYGLKWLVDHGVVPRDKLDGYFLSDVAGIFRTVRFGVAEAHGKAEMMEFNYLVDKGVIRRDNATGRYVVELGKMPGAVADLAKELLEQEATGDRARTESWFMRYGTMPQDLAQALEKAGDVPVDIDPVSDFSED